MPPTPEEIEAQRQAALLAAGAPPAQPNVPFDAAYSDFLVEQPQSHVAQPVADMTGTLPAPAAGSVYTPPAAAAEAPAAAAPAPVQPHTNVMDETRADRLAGMTGGRYMTPANKAAARERDELQSMEDAATHEAGARAAALGERQQSTLENIAKETEYRGAVLDMMDAEAAKRDAAQAEKTAKSEEAMAAGQADLDDTTKKLDPLRMLRGGRGVLFAIANALGAFGASLKGGENYALRITEDAMNRDFAGQQEQVRGKREQLGLLKEQHARLRQAGLDDIAARAGAKATVYEGLARYVEVQKTRLQGQEAKDAADRLANTFYAKANEFQKLMADQRAKPSGVIPNEFERAKRAQELMKGQEGIRQAEVKTQADAAKASADAANGGKELSASDRERRGKLATAVGKVDAGIEASDKMLGLIDSGLVGSISARTPGVILGAVASDETAQANKDFDTLNKQMVNALAAAQGGPITESDKKTAAEIADALRGGALSDDDIRRNLRAGAELLRRNRKYILSGQDPGDVAAVQAQSTAPAAAPVKPSRQQIAERFNARDTK